MEYYDDFIIEQTSPKEISMMNKLKKPMMRH